MATRVAGKFGRLCSGRILDFSDHKSGLFDLITWRFPGRVGSDCTSRVIVFDHLTIFAVDLVFYAQARLT